MCNAAGSREAHERMAAESRGRGAWPEPLGQLLLHAEHAHLAGEVLCTWALAQSFALQIEISPFSANDLCAALQRGGESVLLGELHVRLLRALLRNAPWLREVQVQPPLDASQLLQQLPTAEAVTASNWP